MTIWFVSGSSIGKELRSGAFVPLVQAFAKAQVLVKLLFGERVLIKLFIDVFFAFNMIRFSFYFSFQASLLVLHITPPLLGSHRFLAFLAIATAFLHSTSHQGGLGSDFIVSCVLVSIIPLDLVASRRALR